MTMYAKTTGWLQLVAMIVLCGGCSYCCHSEDGLTEDYYAHSCPAAELVVRSVMLVSIAADPNLPAAMIRLHFHDCFVDGCDGSVLLNLADGEQFASPNNNSLRGLDVVDNIKAALERVCKQTVSCADILAISARDSSVLTGGPNWKVVLGRKDSLTANQRDANTALPGSFDPLPDIVTKFEAVGLTAQDMVVLAGAHTLGRASCPRFQSRLYNFNGTGNADPTLNTTYLSQLRDLCPNVTDVNANINLTTALDLVSPRAFDNQFYKNLLAYNGLLFSDQQLFSFPNHTASVAPFVTAFASDQAAFFANFSNSMIRMGNIRPPAGSQSEVRLDCRRVNPSNSTSP